MTFNQVISIIRFLRSIKPIYLFILVHSTLIIFIYQHVNCLNHRLSIDRPTKRGKENSPSVGHCQCQKKMNDNLLACQQILPESHIVTRLANERASFLNMNDINQIIFGTFDCCHFCLIA
jgi:hypothetical protein